MELFPCIKQHVLKRLNAGLAKTLTYHNVNHTLDVLNRACEIARYENISNPEDLLLLQISALYHDIGFLDTYHGHEERSCAIATEDLPRFGLSKAQVNKISGLIRATKVPQTPLTRLEEIICDADLDYLGRNDFFDIAAGLYPEFCLQGIVKCEQEWDLLQISFLESHRYFTKSSLQRRQAKKLEHLNQIKDRVNLLH